MNIKVQGGQVLSGEIVPSGSKNSAVALLAACILIDRKVTLRKVPNISDMNILVNVLEKLGSKLNWNKEESILEMDNTNLNFENLSKEDIGNMKGSALLWGGMLGRFKKVKFDQLPGGCTLGVRPVDAHYNAFRDFGVVIEEQGVGVAMDASPASAREIWLTEMSPTATSNAVMLATTLNGTSKIVGAASEPSTQDVCNFLVKAGAKISGIGSSILYVEGPATFSDVDFTMLSDHYEIATFLALGACTGGEVKVHDAMPEHFPIINREFAKFGIKIEYEGTTAFVRANQDIRLSNDKVGHTTLVRAQPWPALPVDALPLFVPLALRVPKGSVLYHNWMYESGLFWTGELQKFGANVIMCDPHRVLVTAGNKLKGAKIEAPYIIRAVVAYVMIALMAEGESKILNGDALHRGHYNFAENLRKLGATIEEY